MLDSESQVTSEFDAYMVSGEKLPKVRLEALSRTNVNAQDTKVQQYAGNPRE